MNEFGCRLNSENGVRFRLWAPDAKTVDLMIEGRRMFKMERAPGGFYCLDARDAAAGDRYRYCIDGKLEVPDPASHFNPDGPRGASMVVDHDAFSWGEDESAWKGRPWREAVLYQLHVGTFTPAGTYAAATEHLSGLAAMGITVIQLMPIGAFSGVYGWGYDGVLPYAPYAPYGTPDDLKQFIANAHSLGMAVMLDVVYNHFGPDANFVNSYAREFFSDKHKTAWGASINFDGQGSEFVRDFFVQSALHWLREYHVDGFRFDAVHAMLDDSTPDIMQTVADSLRAEVRRTPGKHFLLVIENDSNDATRLKGDDLTTGNGPFDGQWNGDFHHCLHVLLTGESEGYYDEYTDRTLQQLGRTLTLGFSRQGGPHNAPDTDPRVAADSTIALTASVNFMQNHDQVGNRAFGERLIELCEADSLRLAVAICLLGPPTPLLFMGEEWGATTPFLYFSDSTGAMKEAITKGRRDEFAESPRFADPAVRAQIPDPCDKATFQKSKLDRPPKELAGSDRWRAFYTALLSTRKQHMEPMLSRLQTGRHDFEVIGSRCLRVRWRFAPKAASASDGLDDVLEMVVNLGDKPATVPRSVQHQPVRLVHSLGTIDSAADGDLFGAWSGRWVRHLQPGGSP